MKKKYTKKRIAIFTDNFNVGGIQKSLVNSLNNNDEFVIFVLNCNLIAISQIVFS